MLFLNSSYCQKNCLQEDKPVIAAEIVNISDVPDHLLEQQAESSSIMLLPQSKKNTEPVLTAVEASARSLSAMSPSQFKKNEKSVSAVTEASEKLSSVKPLNISLIEVTLFTALIKKKSHQIFATLMRDIEKALQDKPIIDPATILPSEYHEYLDVFLKKVINTLSPHRSYDHTISIEPGKSPLFGSLIEMSQDELKILKKYLKKHLFKSFICASSSSAAASVLFVKKPEGELCLCVNY